MHESWKRKLILVEGKGGVGKTSVAAAMALALSRRGARVLLCETAAEGHVAAMFGRAPSDGTPLEVAPGLFTLHLVPERCLEEYALIKLHLRTLYRLVFQNPVVRALLRVVPGLDELLIIGKIEYEVRTGPWEHVIVDAPATGEGILLFQLPRVIAETVPTGPLHDDALRIRALLEDPERTVMHLVTLAEELPAEETEQLYQAVVRAVHVPLGRLLVNRLYPEALDEAEARLLDGVTQAHPELKTLREVVHFMERRRGVQERYLERLAAHVPLEQVALPEVLRCASEADRVAQLASLMPTLPAG
jgi:anion-transporting  ArsA/GET3 family ATPase